jgi:hypothetical protein
LPRLASNCDPPDHCLLSSEDYRCEPPVPGSCLMLELFFIQMSFLKFNLFKVFLLTVSFQWFLSAHLLIWVLTFELSRMMCVW